MPPPLEAGTVFPSGLPELRTVASSQSGLASSSSAFPNPPAIPGQRSRRRGTARHGASAGTKVGKGAANALQGANNAPRGILAVEGNPACHPVLPPLPNQTPVPKLGLCLLALAGLESAQQPTGQRSPVRTRRCPATVVPPPIRARG